MPELSVTLDGDVEGPQHISQKVTSLGVRTLEDIKKETPLLPLPAKGGRIGPARITMSSQIGILDSLGHKRPVSQWTRSEERRVGQEGVRTCRYRGSQCH